MPPPPAYRSHPSWPATGSAPAGIPWGPGSPWPGYVTAAVERMRKEDGDKRIDTLFFDYTGYGQHPRVHHHQANAAKLSALVRARMGW